MEDEHFFETCEASPFIWSAAHADVPDSIVSFWSTGETVMVTLLPREQGQLCFHGFMTMDSYCIIMYSNLWYSKLIHIQELYLAKLHLAYIIYNSSFHYSDNSWQCSALIEFCNSSLKWNCDVFALLIRKTTMDCYYFWQKPYYCSML